MTKGAAAVVPPKGTRLTLAVDVSHAVKSEHLPLLKNGWASIGDGLSEDDLVALSTFGVTTSSIFAYTAATGAQWDGKESAFSKVATEIQDQARGYDTALYDSIVKIVKDCPRSLKYKKHRPEMFFFAIGADNASKTTLEELEHALSVQKVPGLHVTLVDASDGGNAEVKEVLEKIPHCSYYACKAEKSAIKAAFDQAKKDYRLRVRAAAAAGGAESAATENADEEEVKAAKPAKAKGGKKKQEAAMA